jgi:hypothetical protein
MAGRPRSLEWLTKIALAALEFQARLFPILINGQITPGHSVFEGATSNCIRQRS